MIRLSHCSPQGDDLIERYRHIRALSLKICELLEPEDYVIQSMPDVSPPKWHLAHTTWFFEAFLLSRFKSGYEVFDPKFHYLFNSYYKTLGPHFLRSNRGFLSRPSLSMILTYRSKVDEEVVRILQSLPEKLDSQSNWKMIENIVTLGLNHEQQHQELLITDIKHILCTNPTHPVFLKSGYRFNPHFQSLHWVEFKGGVFSIGAQSTEFSYDNERPRHRVLLENFQLASRLVTNSEYIEFIEDGGYSRPELWLSLGWDILLADKWEAPLYWEKQDGEWWVSTLNGFQRVEVDEPVCHISFFEADAYARWKGARLPTEAEWEVAAQAFSTAEINNGNFLNLESLRPQSPRDQTAAHRTMLQQAFGDVWEWTASAYLPYPGFQSIAGSEGEYNGKFMSNQMVLRGGSCATPLGHIRASYRNFFPPHTRWQFSGIRMAQRTANGY